MRRSIVVPRVVACLVATATAAASASDPPPAVVATFTRGVQPLVMNKCAAGACHGGPERPAPALARVGLPDNATRTTTLANLRAILDVVGPERSSAGFFRRVAEAHADVPLGRLRPQVEFTPRERTTIHAWLTVVKAAETSRRDGKVVLAASETPADPPPNRLRELLDTAANPPEFPPPEEPRGLIFPSDVNPGDDDPVGPGRP